MSSSVIQWRDVSKHYGDSEAMVLAGVDLDVEGGEFVSVMGPSGSGKTTMLNILGLVDRPTGGLAQFAGQDVSTASRRQLLRMRRSIASVFQEFFLMNDRGVVDNVAVPLLYRGVPVEEARQRAREALDVVELGHRAEARANQVSGGQRQRVALARAMVATPTLLLCDEPTGSLDRATADGVLAIVRSMADHGVSVVMVTHDPAAARWADRTIQLSHLPATEDESQ